MACVNCQRIRSAILHGKMAEAAGLSVAALREKIGVGAKTESEGATIPDAAAIPQQWTEEHKAAASAPKAAKAK